LRVVDRGDAVEQVEESDYRQQHGLEDDQAVAAARRMAPDRAGSAMVVG
jgi:hypothetical protein